MKTIINIIKPKKWLGKVGKNLLQFIAIVSLLLALVIPFFKFNGVALEVFKWLWIGCVILHLDQFAEYKKAREEKLIYPIFSLFAGLTLFYLCNYWSLIPLCVAIVCSIVIGLLELGISVKAYGAMRFTTKAQLKPFPRKASDAVLLGSVYASAVSLFILGHFLSKTTIFVFGIIAMIILFSHVLSVISKGFGESKSIVNTIGIILDIVSVLFLIGYLIYLIPGGEENNNLQEIVLALASAVIGGALTLAGVGWTIKKTDDDRKAEERKKAEPLFSFNIVMDDSRIDTRLICIATATEKINKSYSNVAHFVNSDNSNFYIRGIKYKNEWYKVQNANCVIKNHDVYFSFLTPEISVDNFTMYIKIEDVLGYHHYYKGTYKIQGSKKGEPFTSLVALEKTSEEEANG